MTNQPTRFVGIVEEGVARNLFGEGTRRVDAPTGAIVRMSQDKAVVIAEPGSARAKLYRIAAARGLNPVFSDRVRDEVEAWKADPGIDDDALVDRRDWPFVTIDGPDSMDLDQAVFVQADGDGHLVHYALADAAHFVVPGTALFSEALTRGASFYLPGFMVPMLPRALSEGLVSLNADVDRRAMLFSLRLDAEGRCVERKVCRARIRSRGKLSFGGVQAFYDGGRGFEPGVDESLHLLATVGRRRMRLAELRGVVRYRRQELEVKLGQEGFRFVAREAPRRDVERFNEQVSLLVNVEGARLLRELGSADYVEPIYRVHPAPDVGRLRQLEDQISTIMEHAKLPEDPWRWRLEGDISLQEYLQGLPTEGDEGRIASAIHRQAVMTNVRSTFETDAAGHHGVGADVYARFSAPMREIVGVFLHQETWEALAGGGGQDAALRTRVVERANEVKRTQRALNDESNRLVLDQLFADSLGTTLSGTLMGAGRGRGYVRLDSPPVDIKVYLDLCDDPLHEGRDGCTLRREEREGPVAFHLGEAVQVRVVRRDEERDRWVLSLER